MPSQVVTKLRVKRRQQRLVSKNVKRKARTVRTLRKHRKSAKKVMRGGVGGDAYVLYYHIPIKTKKAIFYTNVPICVIFRDQKSGKVDDIYLFFNSDMNAENITLIVKLILGIKTTEQFELKPAIEDQSSTAGTTVESTDTSSTETKLTKFIGNKFVKLTRCGETIGRMTFCIHSGTFDDTIPLTQASTTKHEINTTNKTYLNLNGAKIMGYLDNTWWDDGFIKTVKANTKQLLVDVTDYYVETENNEPTEEQRQKAIEIFNNRTGDIVEGTGPGEREPGFCVTLDKSTYPNYIEFKNTKTEDILFEIMEEVNHTRYGVTFSEDYKRPEEADLLKIESVSVRYDEKSLTETIMSDITASIKEKHERNNKRDTFEWGKYGKNWWKKYEGENGTMMKHLLKLLEDSKLDRIDCHNYINNLD